MSNILKKSRENLDSAQLLINQGMYNASVHCSYFSLIQYIKYYLNHKCGYLYSDQDESRSNSHEDLIYKLVNKVSNARLSTTIKQECLLLKNERKEADYGINLFDVERSISDRDLSVSTQSKIRRGLGRHE